MAKKRAKNIEELEETGGGDFLSRHGIGADKIVSFFFLFLSVFTFSSLFGLAGSVGTGYFTLITDSLGMYAYLTPLLFLVIFYSLAFNKYDYLRTLNFYLFSLLGLVLFLLLGMFSLTGKLGNNISATIRDSIGVVPTVFLILTIIVASLLKIFDANISDFFKRSNENIDEEEQDGEEDVYENPPGYPPLAQTAAMTAKPLAPKIQPSSTEDDSRTNRGFFARIFGWGKPTETTAMPVNHLEDMEDEDEYEEVEVVREEDVRAQMYKAAGMDIAEEREKVRVRKVRPETATSGRGSTNNDNETALKEFSEKYARPPLSIYTEDSGKSSAGDNKENARIIKRTLADFGISVEMDEVTVGPTVTRYSLKPAQGVKIERITNLANNIALELGVPSVSIIRVHERSLIGVEVPNKSKSRLGLSSLLSNSQFMERKDKLTITFGKDIYGDPVYSDLAKTPHLLVAGTTGSGKSVLVHSLINSLIYKNSPYDLKFILVDPKKVELALYNNLPHLYTPVIKDPKKAVQTLNWLVQEMDRRYAVLEEFGKQNISAYHQYVLEKYKRAESGSATKLPERMPYIVLVIDELADFMMKFPKEMESGIVKLAQMSRAVGIHLILATQRPSTNIITGVIKGNIPSRVALRVASQVDSRVIIDQNGAEKLLGYGDLLFKSADGGDARRIQSPFVSEEEIKDVVAYLRGKYDDLVAEELKTPSGAIVGAQNLNPTPGSYAADTDFSSEDEKFEEAKAVVLQTGKTSVSNLQVRLGTGYARSAKLINMLEQAGVIVTVTDNSGKKVKVVAGGVEQKSKELEQQADELLEAPVSQEQEVDQVLEEKEEKQSSGFFRF